MESVNPFGILKMYKVNQVCMFWNVNWDLRKNGEKRLTECLFRKVNATFHRVSDRIEEWNTLLNNLFILFQFSACHPSFSSTKMIGKNSVEDCHSAKLRILTTSGSPRILCSNPDILAVDHTIDIFCTWKTFEDDWLDFLRDIGLRIYEVIPA